MQSRTDDHRLAVGHVLAEEFRAIHGSAASAGRGDPRALRDLDETLASREAGEGDRLRAVHEAARHLKEGRSALCLSGGGIRSATFCLGLMQALARWSALHRFHYLSTVSGGGYIGSWLSTWIRRCGFEQVMDALARDGGPEPEPLRHLRAFSNYLAPQRGLTTDTLTLVVIFLRNLLLNWIVIVPLLLAGLAVPRLMIGFVSLERGCWTSLAAWTSVWLATILAIAAIAYVTAALPSANPDAHRPAAGRTFRFVFGIGLVVAASLIAWAWAMLAGADATKDCVVVAWAPVQSLGRPVVAALAGVAIHLVGVGVGMALRRRLTSSRATREPSPVHQMPPECHPTTPVPRLAREAHGGPAARGLDVLSIVFSGAGGGLALWFGAEVLFPKPAEHPVTYALLAVPYLLASYWLGTTLYIGFISRCTNEEDREWWARGGATSLQVAVAWMALVALVAHGPTLALAGGLQLVGAIATVGGLSGLVTAIGGYLSRGGLDGPSQERTRWSGLLDRMLLPAAGTVFLLILLVFLSGLTSFALDPWNLRARWVLAMNAPAEPARALARHVERLDDYTKAYRTLRPAPDGAPPTWVNRAGTAPPPFVADAAGSRPGVGDLSVGQRPIDLVAQARDDEAKGLVRAYLQSASKLGAWAATFVHEMRQFHEDVTRRPVGTRFATLFWGWLACLLVPALGSILIGTNRFSLHSMYGNRLVRAYLGASNLTREPDMVTGFDRNDSVPLAELAKPCPPSRLFPVLNAAMNLTTGKQTEWQQRQASSFTMSPLHAGSPLTGYRRVDQYGDSTGMLSLAKAMTISGAAVSPAMGYHTSKPVAFTMAFFNVRLGWWLPNPASDTEMRRSEPRGPLPSLVRELSGLADAEGPDVYLSDGGHFDNLGLYEMVRRRCRIIVVADAGQDGAYQYEDLAAAIRKIRADLGVSIDFSGPAPTPGVKPARRFFLGRINYPEAPERPGYLVYLKPVTLEAEPVDVRQYEVLLRRRGGEQFPHETTADQFFDETQFESYRMLGVVTGEVVRQSLGTLDERSLESLWAARAPTPAAPQTPPAPPAAPAPERRRPDREAARAFDAHPGWLVAASALSSAVAVGLTVTVTGTLGVATPPPVTVNVPQLASLALEKEHYDLLSRLTPDERADGKGGGVLLNRRDRDLLERLTDVTGRAPAEEGRGALVAENPPRGLHLSIADRTLLASLTPDADGRVSRGLALNAEHKKTLDAGLRLNEEDQVKFSARAGLRLNREDEAKLSPDKGLRLNREDQAKFSDPGLQLNRSDRTLIDNGIGLHLDTGTLEDLKKAIGAVKEAVEDGTKKQVDELGSANTKLGEIQDGVQDLLEVGPRRNVRGTRGE